MILPQDFNDLTEYFEELVTFLQKYAWLYEVPVTNILTFDIFSKIPEDWINHLLHLSNDELNSVPTGLTKESWPSSLVQFSQDCQRFTLPVLTSNVPLYKPFNSDNWLQLVPREIWRGMSPKKKIEVEIMSAFVHHESKLLGINKILDLGSGLGYIDRLLLLRGYKVLGIESQVKLVAFATMQKENFFPLNIAKHLHYHNMRICESLIPEVRDAISNDLLKTKCDVMNDYVGQKNHENVNKYDWEKLIPLSKDVSVNDSSDKVCMIGLHSCGDLAVTGIKMYLSLPEVSALVLVPCCYHKMSPTNNCSNEVEIEFALEEALCDTDEHCDKTFSNFPLSETLSRASVGAKFICRPFLRLANQGTNSSWQGWTEADHQRHSFNVLSRAVIEIFAQQEGATFKKCFRRVVRKTSVNEKDFLSYIDESLNRCEFVNQKPSSAFEENKDKIRNSLLNIWEQHKSKQKLAEVVTALQMCLEPVAESLVVADRTCYLHENGVDNVRVVRMMDNKVSPRCLAYIASKN